MKFQKKLTAFAVIISMVMTMIPGSALAASYDSSIVNATEVSEMVSSDKNDHNYFRLYTDGKKLFLEGESTLGENDGVDFTELLSLNAKEAGTGNNVWLQYIKEKWQSGNYKYEMKNDAGIRYKHFNVEVNLKKIQKDGDYILLIIRRYGPGDNDTNVMYKNGIFRIRDNKVSILQYDNVIQNNRDRYAEKVNDPSLYMDPYMTDMANFILKMPNVEGVVPITDEMAEFIKAKAEEIVYGASTDYERGWRIYQFACKNLYYDNKGLAKEKRQYYHPYELLAKMDSKETTDFSEDGKIGTTCIGYASVVAALARALGIPARVVRGHHVNLGSTFHTWGTEPEEDIYKRNHWWAELCIDGQWIMVDANAGSGNTWDAGTGDNAWKYKGLRSYTFYKPTEEQMATSYAIHNIIGGPPVVKVKKPKVTLSRNDNTGKTVINWSPVNNAIDYNVYVSTNNNEGYTKLGTTTGTTMTHTKGAVGVKYYYMVEANGPTNSEMSTVHWRYCDLPRPKNVRVIKLKSNLKNKRTVRNKITWNKVNFKKVKGYSLYVATKKDGPYEEKAYTRGINQTSIIHEGKKGVKYYYKVCANCTEWASRSAMSDIVVSK